MVTGGALLLQPGGDVVVPVAHGASEAEGVRSGAEVAAVTQGSDRGAEDVADFGHGEQFALDGRHVRCDVVDDGSRVVVSAPSLSSSAWY